MVKIRINELARDIEVKAKAIIDYLASIGIEDEESHSSSIEGDLIDQVKAHFRAEAARPNAAAHSRESVPSSEPEVIAETKPAVQEESSKTAMPKSALAETPREIHAEAHHEPLRTPILKKPPMAPPPAPPVHPVAEAGPAAAPRRMPLRPPIRSHVEPPPPTPSVAAAAPPTPPVAPAATAPVLPVTASQPAAPMPPKKAPYVPPPARHPVFDRLKSPSTSTIRPAGAAGASAPSSFRPAPRGPGRPAPPLGPATPGQPIYARRPAPSDSRTGRPGTSPRGPAGEMIPPPGEPNRRGMHPVNKGRTFGTPGRPGDRSRQQGSRERPLRVVAPPRPAPGPIVIDREITITEGITVKDLSEKLGVKARDLIRRLLDLGVLATINQNMDPALAEQVAKSFGAQTSVVTFEEEAVQQMETSAVGQESLVPRAPVVTVMGHVDHGKTSLLDAIRQTNVTAREAGGITQHIGAYTVEIRGRKIVFLDTPGHEAFTRMRARGSKVTDVVVLVVAADDGVMPQTLEAIDHARAGKVPLVVAINKIDKPGALAERVKKQLSDRGLVAEDWGGDTVMVEVSAKQKLNLDLLLEMILLVADLQDLKANPERAATGTVLEARLDRGRGPVSSVLVQNGTLRVGDSLLVGAVFGKIRAMLDDTGRPLDEAPPSTPVEILGLQTLPQAGDQFQAVSDLNRAKQIAFYRESKLREINLAKSSRVTLDQLHDHLKAGTIKELPIILKADVQGSLEVLAESLSKLGDERVKIKVIHTGVGAINISDVLLASASNSLIVGFNVRPEKKASELAQQEKVEIRLHTIIYNVTDEMKKAMVGILEPTQRETIIGKAEVLQTFKVAKLGTIAGVMVAEGRLTRDSSLRLLRDNVVIHEGKVGSLRRFKDDVSEVRNGHECGVSMENYNDIKVGDVIEAFTMEKVAALALA